VYFTFSDTDLVTLLVAAAPYFDVERDIYFKAFEERGSFDKIARVIERIYSRLERDRQVGRSISEIVTEIYEQRPDQDARRAVYLYLIRKAKGKEN
jgi:hypothetical protein